MNTHLNLVSQSPNRHHRALRGLQPCLALVPRVADADGELGAVAVEGER